jgi:hypothetical protein
MSAGLQSARKPWLVPALLGLAFAACGGYALVLAAPCDDAYITFVYARNLASCNGLSFNGERVEGFTSPLWTLLVGLASTPWPARTHVAGIALACVSGAAAIWATFRLARIVGMGRWSSIGPAVLVAGSGDFAYYMGAGMEHCLVAALFAISLRLAIESQGRSASAWLYVSLALLGLVRPEGIAIAAMLGAIHLFASSDRRRSAIGLVLAGVPVVAYLGFRLIYFHDLLPNTYYAKSNLGPASLAAGATYLGRAVAPYAPALAVGVLFALVLQLRSGRRPHTFPGCWTIAGSLIAWLLIVAVEGGDGIVGGRRLVAVLPLVWVLASKPLAGLRPSVGLPVLGALLAVVVASYLRDDGIQGRLHAMRTFGAKRALAGHYMRESLPADTLVAMNPAGLTPYHSGLRTIDMLGLNDRHIARFGHRDRSRPHGDQLGDGAYVLHRDPDVILLGPALNPRPGGSVTERELARLPEFRREYRRVRWGEIGFAYVRRGGRADLPSSGVGQGGGSSIHQDRRK